MEGAATPSIKELVELWLARAENPASGMSDQLNTAKEKIKQLEHKLKEEVKLAEIKKQEGDIQTEKYEKVIMVMAMEIRNLQEGRDPELSNGREKVLKEAREQLATAEAENNVLNEKLEEAHKTVKEVIKSRNTLMKVVESVSNTKKVKKKIPNIKCREFNKPDGCPCGEKCKFDHIEDQGLGKEADCSYWLDGKCRFSEKVCWNKHDPDKKGQNVKSNEAWNSVFQERQEEQRPPSGLDGEGWVESTSRKTKRRMRHLWRRRRGFRRWTDPK